VKQLFLDANVVFTAAHNPSGKAALIIELAAAGYWRIMTSRLAVTEARRNLERKYPSALPNLDSWLANWVIITGSDGQGCPIDLPLKDRPIFEAALLGQATHLLTGDIRHFGRFMGMPELTCGIWVQTVADFLNDQLSGGPH
jgi:predicted nucleic acid-binding protein